MEVTAQTLNNLWILISAGLVFLMQAGFLALESGLTRSKNNINVALKNLVDFGITTLLFWLFGFALMFGPTINGLVGSAEASTLAPQFATNGSNINLIVFLIFQVMFCGTAVTIISGSVAERMNFGSYIIITALISGFVYPIFGHWAWSNLNGAYGESLTGILGKAGFVDFAGSSVVHSVGGWAALAILFIIGPRAGRFPKDGPPAQIPASNMPIAAFGVLLLWIGWFGFNGGSILAMNDQVVLVIANTVIGGAGGLTAGLFIGWIFNNRVDVGSVMNGTLAGLVAITANAHVVSTHDALIIGAVGGVVMYIVDRMLIRYRIDDAVGAIPVHLGAGIWGTLAVGLFGDAAALGTNLSRLDQIGVQIVGIILCGLWTFLTVYVVLRIVNRFFPLRVSEEDERIGLNVSEHGARSDILDLFEIMDKQTQTGNLSLRVPEEPFTQVGQIAVRYNMVIGALEEAINRTEAIVQTAMDGIITFTSDTLAIVTLNPAAETMFGYPTNRLVNKPISEIIEPPKDLPEFFSTNYVHQFLNDLTGSLSTMELIGRRADGSRFPMEITVNRAEANESVFYAGTFRDITERKEAEEALRSSEEYFRLMIQNASDVITITDNEGIINFMSPSVRQILGHHAEDMLDNSIFVFIHPDDSALMVSYITQLMRSRRPGNLLQIRMLHQDGSWRTIQTIGNNLIDIPSIAGIVFNSRDITDQVQTETALKETENRFRDLFEQSPDAIFVQDMDGKILDVNPAACELYKMDRTDLLGKNAIDLVPPDARDDSNQRFVRVGDNPTAYIIESQSYASDGTVVPVEIRANPIEFSGEQAILLHIRDITERKEAERAITESEANLSALIENTQDWIWSVDTQLRLVIFNTTAKTVFESLYDANVEAGQPILNILPLDQVTLWQERYDRALDHEHFIVEEHYDFSDNIALEIEISFNPIISNDDVVTGVSCIARDITERKRFEEELRIAKDNAETANRSKSAFLANMSHELRTPLNAIIGYSEMLEEDAVDYGHDDMVPDLGKIRQAGNHLLDIINSILDLSKIEAGRMELYLETFSVQEILNSVLSTIKPLAQRNNNKLIYNVEENVGELHSDATKVRQLLFNLLSNAAKFTEDGEITLSVQRIHRQNKDWIVFEITDTGIGMTQAQMNDIFTEFMQADVSTTRKFGGTGLGLTITRRFCEMMGGNIDVDSVYGEGTTFTVTLPAIVEDIRIATGEMTIVTPEMPLVENRHTYNREEAEHGLVLVIDDDPTVRDLIARSLAREGYAIETAASGMEGLQKAKAIVPDAITLDVMMQGIDGWTVLSELKADPTLAHIPVVMITIVDNKSRGFAMGAVGYLTKPIDRKQLVDILSRYRKQGRDDDTPSGMILVVEDDADTRDVMKRTLEREGWWVVEAEHGGVALEVLENASPDLILLDLMMPEMDGFDFIGELQKTEAGRAIPVVVITAKDLTEEDLNRLNGRVEQVVAKHSYERESLLKEISNLVAAQLRRRE